MDAAADLASCLDPRRLAAASETPRALAPPTLPRVALRAAGSLRSPLRRSSQPELERLAAAGGVPRHHVDPRPGMERVRAWLRSAQELDVVRVID